MFFPKFLAQALLLSGASWAIPISPDTDAQVGYPLLESAESAEEPTGDISEVATKTTRGEQAFSPSQASWNGDETQALTIHNAARATQGLPPLAWDANLAADAQSWADSLRNSGAFGHSQPSMREDQGENLAYYATTLGSVPNPILRATQEWVDEAGIYNGETLPGGNFEKYGHYTQIMWSGTTNVGMASTTDGQGRFWVVARYSPPGNIMGQRPYN